MIKLLLLLPALFFSAGCRRDLTGLTFNLNYQTSITVPSSTGINIPVVIPTPDVATNSSTEFKNQGIDASKVRECFLKQMVLSIPNPPDQNFNFLKSIHLFIVSPNLPEIEVAYRDNIPYGQQRIELTPISQDVSSYVKEDSFKIRARLVTREAVLKEITIQVNLQIEVYASLL